MMTFASATVAVVSAFLCVVASLRGETWFDRTVSAAILAFTAGVSAGTILVVNF